MDCPDNCIRGINSFDHIYQEKYVVGALFAPNPNEKVEKDNHIYTETSINWSNNEELEKIINFTVNFSNEKGIAFPHGSVYVHTYILERLKNKYGSENFDFITTPDFEHNNPYHGDILFNENLPKKLIRTITGYIAENASDIYRK